jgi:hypothetical protein
VADHGAKVFPTRKCGGKDQQAPEVSRPGEVPVDIRGELLKIAFGERSLWFDEHNALFFHDLVCEHDDRGL